MSLHNISKRPKLECPTQMNILSLPDEMLASVFKYTNLKGSAKIRKINRRINEIFSKYNIKTRKLDYLSLRFETRCQLIQNVDRRWGRTFIEQKDDQLKLELKKMNKFSFEKTFVPKDGEDLLALLQRLLQLVFKQVKSIEHLYVSSDGQKPIYFNGDVIKILRDSHKKPIRGLKSTDIRFKFGSQLELKQFLYHFKFEHLEVVCTKKDEIDYTLSDDIIDGLSFKTLIWPHPSDITIEGLRRLFDINIPQQLVLTCKNITLNDYAHLLKDLKLHDGNCGNNFSNMFNNNGINWNFYEIEVAANMSKEEIARICRNPIFKTFRTHYPYRKREIDLEAEIIDVDSIPSRIQLYTEGYKAVHCRKLLAQEGRW